MWVLLLCLLCLALFLGSRKPQKFPPGPPRLPLVGFLPFIEKELNFKQMWRLSSTYGSSVVGIYFGNQPAVVVNGWEAVKESLFNDDLNGRPENIFLKISDNGLRRGVMFVDGDLWKEQRRFTLHHFRNLGFGKKSHESVIHEELTELMDEMQTMKGGIPLQSLLGVSSINILWAMMGGQRLSRNDPELAYLVDRLNKLFRAGEVSGGVVSLFPALRHILPDSSSFNTVLNGRRLVQAFIKKAVTEHQASLDPDNLRDFIDIYVNHMNNNTDQDSFTERQLLSTCTDIFSAGVETGSSSVCFGLLMMLQHPEVLDRVQQELDQVVGRSRLPSYEDRAKLVYTEATLCEVFRFRGAAPLTVPHTARCHTTLQGYHIPADTMVLNNLYSVHMDPQYWKDPQTFRPERFINPDGSLRKDERLMPFGKGRRACLGEPLARMTNFLGFTCLVQRFSLSLDPAVPLHNTEGKFGFTLGPPDFRILVEPRY